MTGEVQGRAPRSYREFNLRFSAFNPADGSFKVWVEGQAPGGAMSPDEAVQRNYDAKAFWTNPAMGIGGPLGNLEKRRLDEAGILQFGVQLAALALPEGEIRSLFERSLAALGAVEGLRLRLRIDALPLAQLPWEFLALPESGSQPQPRDFLALRDEISIVRSDTVKAPPPKRLKQPVARIAGIFSSPDGQPELTVDNDRELIEAAISRINAQAKQKLLEPLWVTRPATVHAVEQAFAGQRADIFHFAGHGVFDPVVQVGKLLLEKGDYSVEEYSAAQLASLLHTMDVRLAVLGACQTGRRDGQNPWGGIAPALVLAQIPAVIANQFIIDTTNAERLVETVYPLVLGGFSVDEAVAAARGVIFRSSGLAQRDWGSVVHYLGPEDGILFDASQPDNITEDGKSVFFDMAVKVRDIMASKATIADLEHMPDKGIKFTFTGRDVKKEVNDITFLRYGKNTPEEDD